MSEGKKVEAIILEDDIGVQRTLARQIPKDIVYVMVGTSEALRKALSDNLETQIFILDDRVPPKEGEGETYQLIHNARTILETRPDAKIWCTGSMCSSETINFCRESEIPMLRDKMEMVEILRENVKKT